MADIKEVIVYSNGNSKELKTWSNVPYFFTDELIKNGIKVDRVNYDYSNDKNIIKLASKFFRKAITIIKGKTIWKYNYTDYCENKVCSFLEKQNSIYRNADLQVMFGFSYAIKSDIPFVMISDWTIDYRLKNKYKREPLSIEKKLIDKQYKMMDRADAIISVFPSSYEDIKKRFPNKTYFLGHFVNALSNYPVDFSKKYNSNKILFIGRKKAYKSGLEKAIKIINYYNENNDEKLFLSIIGMKESDINSIDKKYCSFYGYLDKSNPTQTDTYYSLIKESKLMINTTSEWNGVSSLFEGMYYGTPIISSRNKEIELLVNQEDVIAYCEDDESLDSIATKINEILKMNKQDYEELCDKAHKFADQFTWDKYIKKFIDLANKIVDNRNNSIE